MIHWRMRLLILLLTVLTLSANETNVELYCTEIFDLQTSAISCAPFTGDIDAATCSIDGSPPTPCELSVYEIDQFSFSPDIHTLTIVFNLTTGDEGVHQYNFTGRVRERLVIETDSSEGVINATEGDFFAISLSAIGNSYDLVPVMITALSYSEYAERGFNLENHFDPNLIPTSAADEYDHGFGMGKLVSFGGLFYSGRGFLIPVYDDGIDEDVEGLIIFLEVMESELDPRDVGQIDLIRSAYLIRISPTDASTFQIIVGEVELETRSDLLNVAVTPPSSLAVVFVTDDTQTAIVTEGVTVHLDWSRWMTEALGDSAGNANYTLRRTQLDEYRNPVGPPEVAELSESRERITLLFNVERYEYLVLINRVIVRAENTEDPDRAFYELEACVPVQSDMTECFRSGIIIYAIPDPIGLVCTVTGSNLITFECDSVNAVISEVSCIYDNSPGAEEETCDLPATIDYTRFDQDPGEHNFSIITTSTFGDLANYSYSFTIPALECVQMTEPGMTTLICSSRVTLVGQPLCIFTNLRQVSCDDLGNIVLTSSMYPSHIGLSNLSILATDDTLERIREIVQILLSEEQLVECSATLNCSSNGTLMSARECCVNSVDGLSYSIQGQQQLCHTCIVFGWFQDYFTGMEQGPAHMIQAGYLKGGEQAGVEIILKVVSQLDNASTADFSIHTETVRLSPTAAVGDPISTAAVVFIVDGVPEGEESFTLELVLHAPSTLLTLPAGEGVFFRNFISLTIGDSDVAIGGSNTVAIIGSTVGIVVFLLIVGVSVTVIVTCYGRHSKTFLTKKDHIANDEDSHHVHFHESLFVDSPAESERAIAMTVQSSYKLDIPLHLIIPSSNIKLTETIGQGEFGIVYKGHVVRNRGSGQYLNEYLAIKTLKGFYDRATVRDMLKECSEMSNFNHPNVLMLKGVCLDGGPAPYIIMPFMANGSLLAYLKKNKKSLDISHENADNEDVESVYKQLMDMCIQVAKGMEYLAGMNVVHRDLAARNCMIDTNFVIKVADFGLSERTGIKDYFRLDKATTVKLPLKWLPPESINNHIFSEKSDVWAYGVTCWEVFTGGKVPYVDLAPADIPKQLASGYWLEKPQNEACSSEVYELMLQCWSLDPSERPSFSHLVEFLSQTLEGSSGYMDVGAFGTNSECTMTESEANVIQETSRKELSPGES